MEYTNIAVGSANGWVASVATYSDLPDPVIHNGETYLVIKNQGIPILNFKSKGLWYAETGAWSYLGSVPDILKDDTFRVINSTDITKSVQFEVSGISTGQNRIVTIPDESGTLALQAYVNAKIPMGVNNNILLSDGAGNAKDSEKAIGNASGNIPLNNSIENAGLKAQYARLLFTRSSSDTNSILDMALSDFATYGQGLHYYTIKAINPIDPARPWTVDSQAVLMGYPNYARLIAFKLNSKAIAIRVLNGGTWDAAWTYLTDDSGNPLHPSVATTASAANAYIGANGTTILKSTSSARYKTDIRDLPDSSTLDQLRPVLYKSNPEVVPNDDPTLDHYGFIAEDIDEFDNKLVQYIVNDAGEKVPDGVQYDRITVLLVKRIQELKSDLSDAKSSVDSLSEKVKALEDRLTKAGIQ